MTKTHRQILAKTHSFELRVARFVSRALPLDISLSEIITIGHVSKSLLSAVRMVDEGEKGGKMKKWLKEKQVPGWVATLGLGMWLVGGLSALWVTPATSSAIQVVGSAIIGTSLVLLVISEWPDYPDE